MNTKGPTQFAIASVFKKETFAISEDEVVIKPTAEPEAEIDIPKGTFDKAAELQLNVRLFSSRYMIIIIQVIGYKDIRTTV